MNFLKEVFIKNWLLIFSQIIFFSLLQSCSGSRFGERLTNSFDTPLDGVESSKKTEDKGIKKILLNKEDNKPISKEKLFSNSNKASSVIRRDKSEPSLKAFKPRKLKPYRIIIRLYGEDPSAPAQIVTNALRKAGVEFEVEKIEKFDFDINFKNSSSR